MAGSSDDIDTEASLSPAKRAEKVRLAAALRDNLKRRKAQLRHRAEAVSSADSTGPKIPR